MIRTIRFSALLLTATAMSTMLAAQARAQADAQDVGYNDEEEDIVITGARERGAVVGDIKPEQQFDAADIRALGVSNINDLLAQLGPQLESASGKPPVTLLEGKRISSFREIASLPAEAIARVDILPEEVGLRYGYSADQKVMNIVLRQRFRAFTGEVSGRGPTKGQGLNQEYELGHLSIRNGQRVNINAEYNHTGDILETDRGLTSPESIVRTLAPETETFTVNASYDRPLNDRTQATLTGEIGTSRSASMVGLALPSITIPGGTPYANGATDRLYYPAAPGLSGLDRSSSSQNGKVGLTVNAMRSTGQWTLTANYEREDSRGITDRPYDLSAYAAALANGDAAADPALPIAAAYLFTRPADETQTRQDTANIDFIYNRPLFALPAGDVQATVTVSGSLMRLESSRERDFSITESRIGRDSGSGSLNLSFPITEASSGIGRISAHANAGLDELSDAGTLRSLGFGFNWTPKSGINLSASYSDEETAAMPSQLGNPLTVTQFVPVFDYVRGESLLVTTLSGGNPLLDNARDKNFRFGLVVSALKDPNLNLSVDYSHRSTSGGISNFPGVTAETAAAFPGRFTRDANGRLTQVDLRPINIAEETRDSLRWGLNFSKRLKTPQSQIDAMRAAFERRRAPNGASSGGRDGQRGQQAAGAGQERTATQSADAPPVGDGPPPPEPGSANGPGAGPPRGGGFGGFRGGRGGGGGGRISFAIYHEWTFKNTTQLAPTLPVLDLLSGASLGSGAGPSRHKIEIRSGISQSGYGLRLSGDWSSATHISGVAGIPTSQLRFGDLATVQLRLFANLTQMPKLIEKVPLLRGTRVQFSVDNVFDARQAVTDGTGAVPFAYQPAFLDPVGRTVRVSLRKLFF